MSETVDRDALAGGMYHLSMDTVHMLRLSAGSASMPRANVDADSALVEVDSALGPVDVMESYRLSQRRYLVAINPKGQLTVFKENGTLHGTAQTAGQVRVTQSDAGCCTSSKKGKQWPRLCRLASKWLVCRYHTDNTPLSYENLHEHGGVIKPTCDLIFEATEL
jgi:hypothetical protein